GRLRGPECAARDARDFGMGGPFDGRRALRLPGLALRGTAGCSRGHALTGRTTVAQSASISRTVAARYAQAVFDIAQGDGALDDLAREVDALADALEVSPDLRAVIASPVLSRDEQAGAVGAVVERMGLGPTLRH